MKKNRISVLRSLMIQKSCLFIILHMHLLHKIAPYPEALQPAFNRVIDCLREVFTGKLEKKSAADFVLQAVAVFVDPAAE